MAPDIQLGRGTVESHFGAFVLLGLLLACSDWRPIVLAAGLFAVDVRSGTAQALKSALQKMEAAIVAVRTCAGSIEATSVEMALGNADLNHRTEAQASGVDAVAL